MAALLLAAAAVAQTPSAEAPAPGGDVTELGLEDLLNRPVQISTRTETTVDEAPGTVTVIEREELTAMGARTLGDVLRMVPGFDSARASLGNGDPVDSFFGRGLKSDFGQNVLVLLNGRNKLNDLTFASPWLSQRVSAELIERVEVIRGPGSALYGGSAFSGVVNLVTRDVAGPDGTFASVLYGSYNALHVHALHKRELFGWHVAAQGKVFAEGGSAYEALHYDKSYPARVGGGGELPAWQRVTDGIRPSFDASLAVSSPDHRFRAQLWHTHHAPHPWLTGLYPNPALQQYGWLAAQTLVHAELDVTGHLTLGAHYSNMYRGQRGVLSPVLGPPATELRLDPERALGAEDLFGSSERNDQLQVDATFRYELGSHELMAGVALSRENQWGSTATYWGEHFDPSLPDAEVTSTLPQEGLIAYPDHARYAGALFAQDVWKLHRTLSLTLGLRYDKYLDVADSLILSPRAAVVWQPFQDHFFKLLYGQGFRPPSGFEQLGILSGSNTGNPEVRPERIFTGELAYITYFSTVRLQVSGYVSRVVDAIAAVDDGDPAKPNKVANTGEVRVLGAEVELQGRSWWLNYTLLGSRSPDPASPTGYSPTPYVSPQLLNAGVHFDLLEPLRFSAQVFIRAPRGLPGGGQTDFQVSCDAKLRYRLSMFDLAVGVSNLLDQRYRFPLNDGGQYGAPYRGTELYAQVELRL